MNTSLRLAFFAFTGWAMLAQAEAFPEKDSKFPVKARPEAQLTIGECCDAKGAFDVPPSFKTPGLKHDGASGEWRNGTGAGIQAAGFECQTCTVKFDNDDVVYKTGVVCRNKGIAKPLFVQGVFNGNIIAVDLSPGNASNLSCKDVAEACAKLAVNLQGGQSYKPKICYGPASPAIVDPNKNVVVPGDGRCPKEDTDKATGLICIKLEGKPSRFGPPVCVADPNPKAPAMKCPMGLPKRTVSCNG